MLKVESVTARDPLRFPEMGAWSRPEAWIALCERFGASAQTIAAAYLHDTMEDQAISYEELLREFGQQVADIVRELSDTPPTPGLNRKQRKEMDRERLSTASAEAQTIKCADLISNTSSIAEFDPGFARIYLPEKRAILEVLTVAHHRAGADGKGTRRHAAALSL
jgi:(p)ppGpp synthase/HD superfamily hydrolase